MLWWKRRNKTPDKKQPIFGRIENPVDLKSIRFPYLRESINYGDTHFIAYILSDDGKRVPIKALNCGWPGNDKAGRALPWRIKSILCDGDYGHLTLQDAFSIHHYNTLEDDMPRIKGRIWICDLETAAAMKLITRPQYGWLLGAEHFGSRENDL